MPVIPRLAGLSERCIACTKTNKDILCGPTSGRTSSKYLSLNSEEIHNRGEFNVNPLKCKPWTVTVKKREVPEQGHANLELLQNLLEIRAAELEPDILAEVNGLIDNVCIQ